MCTRLLGTMVCVLLVLMLSGVRAQKVLQIGEWELVAEREWRAPVTSPTSPPYRDGDIFVAITDAGVVFRKTTVCPPHPPFLERNEAVTVWRARDTHTYGVRCNGEGFVGVMLLGDAFMSTLPIEVREYLKEEERELEKKRFHKLDNAHNT